MWWENELVIRGKMCKNCFGCEWYINNPPLPIHDVCLYNEYLASRINDVSKSMFICKKVNWFQPGMWTEKSDITEIQLFIFS